MPKPNPVKGFGAPDPRTVAHGADGRGEGPVATVRANPLKNYREAAADGADANCPPQSGQETGKAVWSARL